MAANLWHMMVLSKAWRYGIAVMSCGLALAVAIPLDSPSSCFFLAVIVSSLYGGKGPGVVSVVLSSLAFDYFFLPPKYHLWIEPSSFPRFAAFLVPALLITVVIEAKLRVEEARRQIDARYRQVSADALAQAQKSEARLRLTGEAKTDRQYSAFAAMVRRIRVLFKRAAHEEVVLDLNEVIGEVLSLLRSAAGNRRSRPIAAIDTQPAPERDRSHGSLDRSHQAIIHLFQTGA